MIVGSSFEGDTDKVGAYQQHDVYGNALSIIVSGCRDHVLSAAEMLRSEWPLHWTRIDTFDHRTLQEGHDLLAAAWRYHYRPAQHDLLKSHEDISFETLRSQWLHWLRTEVATWRQDPYGVALVMDILTHQNTSVGFDAEDKLAAWLRGRFDSVPWCRRHSRPIVKSTPLKPPGPSIGTDPGSEAPDSDECAGVTAGSPACRLLPCVTVRQQAEREGWGPHE